MAPVTKPLAGMRNRQGARGRLKEDRSLVVGANRAEYAFLRKPFGRGRMDVELRGDLRAVSQPARCT